MPKREDGGWKGRIRRGVDDLLAELENLPEQDAVRRIAESLTPSNRDIGPKTVDGLYADLFVKNKGKCGADRMREENAFEVFSEKRHSEAFLELVNLAVRGRVKGETDEPVTSDTHRLIRLPSSLHGKTGFEVVPMSRDALDGFDPFADAVPKAFDEEEVSVRAHAPVSLTLKGDRYELGEEAGRVPTYVAVHLICRNLASIDN
jgi:DNA primase small subunit